MMSVIEALAVKAYLEPKVKSDLVVSYEAYRLLREAQNTIRFRAEMVIERESESIRQLDKGIERMRLTPPKGDNPAA